MSQTYVENISMTKKNQLYFINRFILYGQLITDNSVANFEKIEILGKADKHVEEVIVWPLQVFSEEIDYLELW